MGGRISIVNQRLECGKHTGDLEVQGSQLQRIKIEEKWIPSIIDEESILTIAGLLLKVALKLAMQKNYVPKNQIEFILWSAI